MPALSPALPRTCGLRIPVGEAIRRLAHDAAPGAPGMTRRTLLCELGAHDAGTEHAAIARLLHRPQGGAAWVHWAEATNPSCTAREDCPRSGEVPGQTCALFTGHRGACSFALDSALAEDETRIGRIDDARSVLIHHTLHEDTAVLRAGFDSVLLAWDELRARRIWDRLAAWDQAAVLLIVSRAQMPPTAQDRAGIVDRLVQDSELLTRLWLAGELPNGQDAVTLCEALTRLPAGWQAVVLGGQRAPKAHRSTPRVPLDEAVRTAAGLAAAGADPPEAGRAWEADWDDTDDRRQGASAATRLVRLPFGWRVDAVRRIAHGLSALGAGHEAAMAINLLRGYGVYLAWNAPDRAPHPAPGPVGTLRTTSS